MTKLDPDQTKIHLIGNNVTGNKKGEKLMKFLSKSMQPSKVKVESPLELGQAGEWIKKMWGFLQLLGGGGGGGGSDKLGKWGPASWDPELPSSSPALLWSPA